MSAEADINWSEWRPLRPRLALAEQTLSELLDGGQAFRWWRQPDGSWLGIWGNSIARLRLKDGALVWSAPIALAHHVESALASYLGLDRNFDQLTDQLPWRSDAVLAAAIEGFRALRLLRQPFGETLLAFLCSATKQIVQIKQMVALLAARHGTPLLKTHTAGSFNRLPTWAEIAALSDAELRGCLLGFRARYIRLTAEHLAAHPGWLEETELLPYAEAKSRLCLLPGVGEKVADCVLLFGAGRLEAFPVDVWILKTMEQRYQLDGWTPRQVAHFGRVHFGPSAGLAQQFLFSHERALARAVSASSRP